MVPVATTTEMTVESTNFTWAALVLSFGRPGWVTTQNIDNVATWMTAEEPPWRWYHADDPLNANDLAEGDIEAFPDLVTAARATAAVLLQTNMDGIAAALDASLSSPGFSAAVCRSPWAGSHYGVAAAGAPPEYIVPGRGLNYLATLPLPPVVVAPGVLPTPPSPTPTPNPTPPPPPQGDCKMWFTDIVTGKIVATDPEGNIWAEKNAIPVVVTMAKINPGPGEPVVGIAQERDLDGSWGYSFITKPTGGSGNLGIYSTYHVNRDGSF